MAFDILPTQGFGDVRFGMAIEEVRSILGTELDKSSYEGVTEFYFQNFINVSTRDGKVYQIGATRRSTDVMYKGLDIFNADPMEILKEFQADAGGAFEGFGFVVFLPLGVSLTGFHDGDLDNKAVAVAVLDEWQAVASELTPITFS